MKRPNGYGCIRKLAGNRRKPYAVWLTVKSLVDEAGNAKRVRRYLGYYKTYQEAEAALVDYQRNPIDLDAGKLTFADVYERWMRAAGDKRPYYAPSCFQHLAPLHDMKITDIRRRHVQAAIDAIDRGPVTKSKSKIVCGKVFKYAVDMELVATDQSKGVKVPSQEPSGKHKAFAPEEVETLWRHADDPGARMALVLIYTGLRATELCTIKSENVHLSERYMVGGLKTRSGINRIIPIHERIVPFIEAWLADGGEYLFSPSPGADFGDRDSFVGKQRLSRAALYLFGASPVLRSLPREHLTHDCRHTCQTWLDNCDVNDRTKDMILGHFSQGIGQRVYTHKTIGQLVEAINRI